ncbi:MAG: hypothetical protein ACERLB_12850 [Gammaproteobacteria bacterium]
MNASSRAGGVRWLFHLPLLLVFLAVSHSALAADPANIHWAYSAYFGTGTYKLGDLATVAVVRPTPGWTFREAAIDEDGKRTVGWRLRVPVAIGYHQFDFRNISEIIDPGNVVTLSVIPGVEMDIPVTRRWLLRPLLYAGWGTVTDSSETAWSYWTGIKSRYTWNTGKLEWSLLNAISYVGFNPNADGTEGMVPIMAGFEWAYPFTNWKMDNVPLELSWHLEYTSFQNDLDIPPFLDSNTERVLDLWQVGVALGKHGKSFEFLGMEWDRIGLAVERGGNNNLRGIKIYFSSVFDK